MSFQQKKGFKFLVLGFLGLSLTIYLFSANEEVLYLYDGASTYEEDGLQLSNFKIIGPSPWKAGDNVIVEFDLKNITGKPIYFGKRGIFVGCLNPNGNKEDFGHQYSKFSLVKGKSVHVKAVKKLDKKGKWTFWPSYFLGSTRWVKHRRGYGPYKWKAAQIKPSTKPIKKFKRAIADLTKPVRVTREKQIQLAREKQVPPDQDNIVRGNQDVLLKKYESSDKKFIKKKIGDYMVYRHVRKIGEAIVEGDVIRYKFDWKTQTLLDKKTQWRRDLPGQIRVDFGKSQAEALVEGEVRFSRLYIISPKSRVFRIRPVPLDPCWIVSSVVKGRLVISIIDAVTGEFLGFGEPPPAAQGYSLVGPNDWTGCAGLPQYWVKIRDNARDWFVQMGYPAQTAQFPDESDVRSYIYNYETTVFYEIAHSGTHYDEPWNTTFLSSCHPGKVTALDVRDWIIHCPKMPFAFLTSCFSMCDTEAVNTLSYSFRKGSNHDTASVGGCGISEPRCYPVCWNSYFDWQDDFFTHLSQGVSVGQAFDAAMANYSECDGCIRLAGDETVRLVPAINRNQAIIAYWPIREGGGSNVADYTPGHNHGTREGATWTQGISGPGGIMRHWTSALAFNGGSDFVMVDYDAAFNLTNFTLVAWVRFTNSSQRAGIISRPSDGDHTHGHSFFNMYTHSGRIGGAVHGEGSASSVNIHSSDNFADGVWHKCTFVRNVNLNTIRIYVDGQLQETYPNASPGNMSHNRKGLYIGSLDDNTGFFNGAICNVKIWGKALTQDEIQENFIWEADEDGDGIALQVDPGPGVYSNFFKNGSTRGTITDRGDQVLILIPKSGGVLVKADGAGGTTPATVRVNGSTVTYTLNPGDEILVQ